MVRSLLDRNESYIELQKFNKWGAYIWELQKKKSVF